MKQPTRGREVLYLTQKDVVDVGLTRNDVLDLIHVALAEHGHKRFEMPAKIGLHPLPDTFMHAMPAWVPAVKACGIKWVESFPENSIKHGLPQTSGLIILNCPETGWPLGILDAIWVTAKRTAAVTAVACRYLARKDTEVAGIIGAGVQGREHALFLPEVLPNLNTIKVFDKSPAVAKKFVSDLQPQLPKMKLVECHTIKDAVRGSGVVVSATAILDKPNPQIRDAWVEKGAFIAPIDFDSLWEWATLSRADKFLVDSLAEMQYFMTVGYLPHGLPTLHAEIGEVVVGSKPGREQANELIIDMNIGMGVEDVVIGWEIFRRACEKDLGRILPL